MEPQALTVRTVQGLQGDPGQDGSDGAPGADGSDGLPGPQGEQGEQGDPGEQGESGILGLAIVNSSSGWVAVQGESQVYESSLACSGGQTALSAGVNGVGAMNNIIAIAITGANNDQGYYRVRLKAGSQPSDVTAQLVCATLN
jgi:hypothetical protein